MYSTQCHFSLFDLKSISLSLEFYMLITFLNAHDNPSSIVSCQSPQLTFLRMIKRVPEQMALSLTFS